MLSMWLKDTCTPVHSWKCWLLLTDSQAHWTLVALPQTRSLAFAISQSIGALWPQRLEHHGLAASRRPRPSKWTRPAAIQQARIQETRIREAGSGNGLHAIQELEALESVVSSFPNPQFPVRRICGSRIRALGFPNPHFPVSRVCTFGSRSCICQSKSAVDRKAQMLRFCSVG